MKILGEIKWSYAYMFLIMLSYACHMVYILSFPYIIFFKLCFKLEML